MPTSRLAQFAVGVKRYISFAGKEESVGGPVTRLAQFAIGAQRYVSFAGKELVVPSGPITRLGQMAVGTQRHTSFAGKMPSGGVVLKNPRLFMRNLGRMMNP